MHELAIVTFVVLISQRTPAIRKRFLPMIRQEVSDVVKLGEASVSRARACEVDFVLLDSQKLKIISCYQKKIFLFIKKSAYLLSFSVEMVNHTNAATASPLFAKRSNVRHLAIKLLPLL